MFRITQNMTKRITSCTCVHGYKPQNSEPQLVSKTILN